MGLFDFVDDVLGTDFTGDKAMGKYREGVNAQSAANSQAAQVMERYGKQASEMFLEYLDKGMDAEDAMRESALAAAQSGNEKAIQAYQENYGKAIDAMQAGNEEALGLYNENYQAGLNARSPYDYAATEMIGALPQLQAAMGLPGAGEYDVKASPMYQWQKDQMNQDLTAQMNALGLNNDNASVYIRSQGLGKLGAMETERQMRDLQNMVGVGMQHGASLGQSQFQGARDMAGLASRGAGNMANLYAGGAGNMANIYARGAMSEADILNQGAINRGATLGRAGQILAGWERDNGINQANMLTANGQNAMNMAAMDASRSNPMNELINTGISLWGQGAF